MVVAALLATALLETAAATSARADPSARARVVAAARHHLGVPFRGDCSALVKRVYAEAGVPLRHLVAARSATESLYRSLHPVRRPRAGDLAFFHRTYDRDRGGPGADRFTHVGIVERVNGPRITVIHRSGTGVQRLALNALRPHDPDENGILRRRRPGESPRVRHLAGELLAGYASRWDPMARRPVAAAR